MTLPAVSCEGLGRRYGRTWALVDVNLVVPVGTVQIVAGSNGAGKSTLLRILATAARPDRGTARVSGFDVRTDRDRVRRTVALLGHASYLYESLTARENLAIAARHLGSRREPDELLHQVGLEKRSDEPVSHFSAGMKKRLSFARVLLQDAEVILLDEPYSQLDPEGFLLVDGIVRREKGAGRTVIMSTHMIDRAAPLADAAVVLANGRVAWQGRPGELAGMNGSRGHRL